MRPRSVLLFVLWFLFTFGPVLSVLLSSAVSGAAGCRVDEGSVHPCVIAGFDVGGLLYTLGVLGWLMLVTFPSGVIMAAVAFLVWFLRRGQGKVPGGE